MDKELLNKEIRKVRIAKGELIGKETKVKGADEIDREFMANDLIIFKENIKIGKNKINNGDSGKIKSIGHSYGRSYFEVVFNEGSKEEKILKVPAKEFPKIEHAYAVNTFISQGRTVKNVYQISGMTDRNDQYVAGSRHTLNHFMYFNNKELIDLENKVEEDFPPTQKMVDYVHSLRKKGVISDEQFEKLDLESFLSVRALLNEITPPIQTDEEKKDEFVTRFKNIICATANATYNKTSFDIDFIKEVTARDDNKDIEPEIEVENEDKIAPKPDFVLPKKTNLVDNLKAPSVTSKLGATDKSGDRIYVSKDTKNIHAIEKIQGVENITTSEKGINKNLEDTYQNIKKWILAKTSKSDVIDLGFNMLMKDSRLLSLMLNDSNVDAVITQLKDKFIYNQDIQAHKKLTYFELLETQLNCRYLKYATPSNIDYLIKTFPSILNDEPSDKNDTRPKITTLSQVSNKVVFDTIIKYGKDNKISSLDINNMDYKNLTPLHYSVATNKDLDFIKHIVDFHNPKTNTVTANGDNLLFSHLKSKNPSVETTNYLIGLGQKDNESFSYDTNDNGYTFFDIIEKSKHLTDKTELQEDLAANIIYRSGMYKEPFPYTYEINLKERIKKIEDGSTEITKLEEEINESGRKLTKLEIANIRKIITEARQEIEELDKANNELYRKSINEAATPEDKIEAIKLQSNTYAEIIQKLLNNLVLKIRKNFNFNISKRIIKKYTFLKKLPYDPRIQESSISNKKDIANEKITPIIKK